MTEKVWGEPPLRRVTEKVVFENFSMAPKLTTGFGGNKLVLEMTILSGLKASSARGRHFMYRCRFAHLNLKYRYDAHEWNENAAVRRR